MSSIEILRDALFGNPPSPAMKPSREGVLAAFNELKLDTDAGIAAAATSGTDLAAAAALIAPLVQTAKAAQAAVEQALRDIPESVAAQLDAAVAEAVADGTAEVDADRVAAEAAANAAQLASGTALAASRYFATRTAGEAGSTTGQLFSTDDGAGSVIYYRKTDGGSIEIGRAVTPAALAGRNGAALVGLPQGGTMADAIQFVTPQMFGALGDGLSDDTPAMQAAIDSGFPVQLPIPSVAYRFTDTLRIEPGASIIGAGGAANYDGSPVKVLFAPSTKRDLFNWKSPRTDAPYEFAGVQISGFCVLGTGPGIDTCVDLPLLYNGKIDFFAYTGFDTWIRTRRWQDCRIDGGAQGMRVAGVDFAKAGSSDIPSDVTTTLQINAYIAQGPIAYRALTRAVSDVKIEGTIESVDNACVIARGNKLTFDGFTENVPRTDAGSAWVFGKTGDAPAFETILTVNLRAGFGNTGLSEIVNANAFDVDYVGMLIVSGSIYLYNSLLKTTANTDRVILNGLQSSAIRHFSVDGGIADFRKIVSLGYKPEFMKIAPSATDAFDGALISPTLQLWSSDRGAINNDHLFLDATLNNKLVYRDRFGNFTAPIGALRVSGISDWTVQGGRLTPGEMVQNTNVTLGEPGWWLSTRHSKDVGNNYPGCTTMEGSPVITHPTVGAFFKAEIGDYVTVSDGFGDAVTQRRVINRSSDLKSITLDSAAIATVAAAVSVETEAHKLIPVGQQGAREVGVNPTGNLVPNFRGEEVFRTDTFNFYKATGPTSGDWKLIT